MREIDTLIIHAADTPPNMDIGRKEIDQWHRERGWDGIGYHYVIRRDGTVETGRPERDMGAHARGWNERSIGICLVGGRDGDFDYHISQIMALFYLTNQILLRHNLTYKDVIGHRDVDPNKACPGFNVEELFRGLSPNQELSV